MTKPEIKIKYDGKYPNLCSGRLEVWLDGEYYDFGNHCLCSGGSVYFDDDGDEHVESGEWKWREFGFEPPANLPKYALYPILEAINEQVEHGCCGGCL